MKLKILINNCLDFFFPIHCLDCGVFLSSHASTPYFCSACLENIKLISHGQCGFCSALSHDGKTCQDCHNYDLDYLWAAVRYEHPTIKKALWAYKFKFVSSLQWALGTLLERFILEQGRDHFLNTYRKQLVVMPVPLHPRRQSWRSYNQSELLAKIVATRFKLRLGTNSLSRLKNRQPQTEITDPQKRAKNVSGIFTCSPSKSLQGKTVILVDDVSTTGSTLDACAKMLKKAGVQKVIGLVVAKG